MIKVSRVALFVDRLQAIVPLGHRKRRGVIRQAISVAGAAPGLGRLYEAGGSRLVRVYHYFRLRVEAAGAVTGFALNPGKLCRAGGVARETIQGPIVPRQLVRCLPVGGFRPGFVY